jgi:hypothetical protein
MISFHLLVKIFDPFTEHISVYSVIQIMKYLILVYLNNYGKISKSDTNKKCWWMNVNN